MDISAIPHIFVNFQQLCALVEQQQNSVQMAQAQV
jgi:hypothetical protein